MRNAWKVAVAFTLALGLGGALAQAQPLIIGNTAAFGCGPIATSDFTLGTVTHQFYPDGAGGAACNTGPINQHNGRGLAVGSAFGLLEVYYTELDEVNPGDPFPGFGGSEFIHVANYNAGDGSGDTRLILNPRPGSGIQDLTFAGGTLYVLTGYDYQVPIVYGLNPFTGLVVKAGVPIARPGFTDNSLDGFAVLPNGNYLMNNMGTSCIYSEYNKDSGAFIGNTINVPGGPARCTGVDTDGTSLFFMTDFTAITKTNFAGAMTDFNFFNDPGGEDFIMDISLVHPITIITDVGDGHLWLGLRQSDDQNTRFDFQVELLKNGVLVPGAVGLTRCVGNNLPYPELTRNPTFARDITVAVPAFPPEPLVSGDVLAFRISTRIGTTAGNTFCGGHVSAVGVKLYYDSSNRASNFPLTIQPSPEEKYYLRSDGNACPDGNSGGSAGVTMRTLDTTPPVGVSYKCKESGIVAFNLPTAGANPFAVIGTWSLAAQP